MFSRYAIFIIGFTAAILMLASCLISLVVPFFGGGTPYSFLGAVPLSTFCLLWVWSEWQAFYHRNRKIERRLGKTYIGIAFILGIGVCANSGSALWDGQWPLGFEWIILVMATIATYFGAIGFMRIATARDATRN